MKAEQVARAVETKAPGSTRSAGERNTWVEIDGQRKFRITVPQGHSADLKTGTLNSIRRSTRLTWDQFDDFVRCKMGGPEYEALLRQMMAEGKL